MTARFRFNGPPAGGNSPAQARRSPMGKGEIGHERAAGVAPVAGGELARRTRDAKREALRSGPRYLALCAHHTEPLVAAELRALPEVTEVEVGSGVVTFTGPVAALYRANLHLRCASRVLQQLDDFACAGADELYAAARRIAWEEYLRPDGTLAVSAHGQGPGLDNSMYAALRVKDAICDRLRDRFGVRPDVDVRQPMVRVNVQLYQGTGRGPGQGQEPGTGHRGEPRCALALDSSDPPLHRRGYRHGGGEAPLKETLAAAILALTDYPDGCADAVNAIDATGLTDATGSTEASAASEPAPLAAAEQAAAARSAGEGAGLWPPLVDLCCGSGTLLCEGGLRALRVAPGLSRRFGFMTWRDFDAALWQRLCQEAREQQRPATGPFLYGADLDGRVLQTAQRSLEAAGLMPYGRLACGDLRDAQPPPGRPGIVICNPPYGERLGDEAALVELYRGLGDTLKRRFAGYTAYVFTANLALGRQIGLRPSARHTLYNANLEGRLLQFKLY